MKSIINGELTDNEMIENWKMKGNIYEVLRVIDNKPLFLREHLSRLKRSEETIDIELIDKELKQLIKSLDEPLNNNIFISFNTVTKGRGIFIIKGFYPPLEWYENGIDINTYQIKRKNPNLKIYDDNYKKMIEAHLKDTNVFETLITDEGIINEGSRSNVFFIKNDIVYTPSVEAVLPGITRDKVFEAAKTSKIEIIEGPIYEKDLGTYEGAFITGTSIDLLPVRKIDEIQLKTVAIDCFKRLMTGFMGIRNRDLGIENGE